ncbi:MAG: PPK2 family polyphosphate kinase [Acidimicrobiales bacterium]|nr:PPK2 family polyphosphate kinase [Acidimicrobiales bacterium]
MDTERFRVRPGAIVDLADFSPDSTDGFDGEKDDAKDWSDDISERLSELQVLLHATKAARLLIVLQGMDTSGKDSTTRRVFDAVNPLGIRAAEFKRPTEVELARDYLWRVNMQIPKDGEIVIFNRSHYEDVLVVRVEDLVPRERWEKRYGHIVDFERRLTDEGTIIRKFFLHISKDEQKERLEERLENPTKHWKFEHGDLRTRERWNDYQEAYRVMLERTSTNTAPWYVVPSDRKWFRDLLVGRVLVETLEHLNMDWPEPIKDLSKITID